VPVVITSFAQHASQLRAIRQGFAQIRAPFHKASNKRFISSARACASGMPRDWQ
jgi:hypothetical protein